MNNKILCTFTRMPRLTLGMCLFSKTFEQTLNTMEKSKDTLFTIDSCYAFRIFNDDYSHPTNFLYERCSFPVEISKDIMEQFLSGSKIATSCDRDDTVIKMTFTRLEDVPHFFFSSSKYFNGNKRMLRKLISDSLKHEDYHQFIRSINLVNFAKILSNLRYESKENILQYKQD